MKKIITLLVIIMLSFTVVLFNSNCVFGVSNTVSDLFKEYYYNGTYTKETKINLNVQALIEATKYFHNNCNELERTTYYSEDKLYMFNEVGSVNSGYKNVGGNMEHYYILNEEEITDYVVFDTSVEDFFITLYDLYTNPTNSWKIDKGVYVSTNKEVIDMFRKFCAPCFIGLTESNKNWLSFTKVSVEEVGNSLELKLYVSKINSGFLNNNNLVFAEAKVTKGQNIVVYDEVIDDLNGCDPNDLSALKNAFDNIGDNYLSKNYGYFNDLAVSQINDIYKTNFYNNSTTIYTSNYSYRYSDDLVINEGYVNYSSNLYTVSLDGVGLDDKLSNSNVSLKLYNFYDKYQNNTFTLKDIDSAYIDKYGPKRVVYSNSLIIDYLGWIRIGEYTYQCDRLEVISDFIKICTPGFTNGGTYMTYSKVVVDLNPDNCATMAIKLYASETQTGKLILNHVKKEYPMWYLLNGEAYIYDINQAKVDALENLY